MLVQIIAGAICGKLVFMVLCALVYVVGILSLKFISCLLYTSSGGSERIINDHCQRKEDKTDDPYQVSEGCFRHPSAKPHFVRRGTENRSPEIEKSFG